MPGGGAIIGGPLIGGCAGAPLVGAIAAGEGPPTPLTGPCKPIEIKISLSIYYNLQKYLYILNIIFT